MIVDSRKFRAFDWTLSLAHHGAYLNLDDILATSERLPCRIRSTIPKVGPLLIGPHQTSRGCFSDAESNREDDIQAGTKLELPVWLALNIGSSRRQLLFIDLPLIYRECYRDVFAADPWVVDLRKKGSYFYSLGCHLASLSSPELAAVMTTIENTFQRRIKSLMETALNANQRSVLPLTSRLEELEMALFRIGQHERACLDRWSIRHHERLEASTVARETLELIARSEEAEESERKRLREDHPPLGEQN